MKFRNNPSLIRPPYAWIGVFLCALVLFLAPVLSQGEQVIGETLSVGSCSTDEGLSNAEAAKGYILQVLTPQTNRASQKRSDSGAAAKLNAVEKKMYDALKEKIVLAAKGQVGRAVFSIPFSSIYDNLALTAKDLGLDSLTDGYGLTFDAYQLFCSYTSLDVVKVWHALLFDCPYDLYWHDKTVGITWRWNTGYNSYANVPCVLDGNILKIDSYSTGNFEISFYVAKEYSATNAIGTMVINTALGQAITTAGETIKTIISDNSNKSDLAKLTAYKDKICELVDYNSPAASDPNMPYGNPWQLVWIFDNNPGTKVVCEGYSKGFQYLCDLTWPSGTPVSCSTVSGLMSVSNSASGQHMWNIVTYNGARYLVDVTNCDEGTIGCPDKLFMKGFTATAYGNYQYEIDSKIVCYQYDEATTGVYKDEDLTLDNDPLGPEESNIVRGACGTSASWALNTQTGILMLYGSGSTDSYSGTVPPWNDYKTSITKVVVDRGVTGIGSEAFRNCSGLMTVEVRGILSSIGADAFTGCPQLIGGGKGQFLISTCTNTYLRNWLTSNYINHTLEHDNMVELAPTEVTCTESGWDHVWYCSACGEYTRYDEHPALGHRTVVDPAVAPACETSGLTEGSHCSVCGDIFVAQVVLPALEHQWDEGKVVREATLTESGLRRFTCKRCSQTRDEIIEIRIPVEAPGWVANPDSSWSYGVKDSKTDYCYALVGPHYLGGTLYCFDDQGKMITGWGKANGKWYYASPSGSLYCYGWMQYGNSWYYFRSDGEMATRWVSDGGSWYYMHDDGSMATGWIRDHGQWYYFGGSGTMQTGWLHDGRHWYLLNQNGIMCTGWVSDGGSWYYFTGDGCMATGRTRTDDGWYFFSDLGVMQTGWVHSGGQWYLAGWDGRLADGWKKDGLNWYFFSSGVLQTGWVEDDDAWYWMDQDGIMVTGEHVINGKTEVFDASGQWLRSE